jgi:hypothetical protein
MRRSPLYSKIYRKTNVDGAFLHSKWLTTNEDVTYKKFVGCTKTAQLKNSGKCLCKTRCEWTDQIRKTALGAEVKSILFLYTMDMRATGINMAW